MFPFQFQLIARAHGVYLFALTFNIFFSIIHRGFHMTHHNSEKWSYKDDTLSMLKLKNKINCGDSWPHCTERAFSSNFVESLGEGEFSV